MTAVEWLPLVNLALILFALVALVIVAVALVRRRRMFLEMFVQLAAEMKRDLPGIIVGEIMTRWDLSNYEKRLSEVEAKAEWLIDRQNGSPETP